MILSYHDADFELSSQSRSGLRAGKLVWEDAHESLKASSIIKERFS